MACCGSEREMMPLDKPRFEHDEPDSNNQQLLDFERDLMTIQEPFKEDNDGELEKVNYPYGDANKPLNNCEKPEQDPFKEDNNEELEKANRTYGEANTPLTNWEKPEQDPFTEDNNEELEKANRTYGEANTPLTNCEKPEQEPVKEDNNEELEKANLTNSDANKPLNNYEKPKQASRKKDTGKGQTKRRTNLSKNLSAKHVKLKDKEKELMNKGKTDSRSIHKQGLNEDVFNQDDAVIKPKHSHCGSYIIPNKKLNQSVRLGIILLAVLCIVHISEESSVKWNLRGLVYFGKTAILDCILNVTSNVCHDDTMTRRWSKHGHKTTSVISINGYSSNNSKYEEQVNKHCTVSSLNIKNFDQSDIADYTCGFGLMEYSKELKLEIDSFRSYPAKENINGFLLCSHTNLRLNLKMRNIFPRPTCYSDIENDGVQHKRIRTDLSGVLYTTEDTVEFLLKDRSCSGIIHTFCLFAERKIEVFNSTYDCCSASKPSLALKVSISFLGVTTFAVIMCFVYLCKKRKIGCIQCFYLRRAESLRSEQTLSMFSDSD